MRSVQIPSRDLNAFGSRDQPGCSLHESGGLDTPESALQNPSDA